MRRWAGWKRADGLRLIRTIYVEVPKKNGKTEFAAGLASLLLLGDGEFGGQGYAMAVDKDQAKIAFNKAAVMVQLSEELKLDIVPGKTSLFCPELMASFKAISSAPASKHGFSPSFAIGDETHAWPDGDLADIVHKGTAARRQSLEIYITTAGVRGYGYGWELHDRALKVLDGTIVDPSFLAVIYAAADEDDWTAEATWHKANPGLGVSPKLEFLRAECAKAKESPRLENEFKRYHLNRWTEQITRWLQIETWDKGVGEIPWRELAAYLKGRRALSGVDLSAKVDLTALVHVFPPAERNGLWFVLPRFWMPENRIEFATRRDRLPYRQWIESGALVATPGDVVDYDFVETQLIADKGEFQIDEVAYDSWNALQFSTRMAALGMTMVDFQQGFKSMNAPTKELERLVIAKLLRHGGHPVLREMAKVVSVATDPAGCLKPDKSKAKFRIDGIVATIMGLGRGMVAPEKTEDLNSALERRGLVAV